MSESKDYKARLDSEAETARRITDREAIERAYARMAQLGRPIAAAKPTPNK